MFRRVARSVSEADLSARYTHDAAAAEEAFFGIMTSLEFFPNSPTLNERGRIWLSSLLVLCCL